MKNTKTLEQITRIYRSGKRDGTFVYWEDIPGSSVKSFTTYTFCLNVLGLPIATTKVEGSATKLLDRYDISQYQEVHLPHFGKVLADCVKVAKRDSLRNYGTIVLVEIEKGNCTYVASDGFVMYVATYPTTTKVDISFTLGWNEAKALSLIACDKGYSTHHETDFTAKITPDGTCLHFSKHWRDNLVTVSGLVRLSQIKFPKWRGVMPNLKRGTWGTWTPIEKTKCNQVVLRNGMATYQKSLPNKPVEVEKQHNSIDPVLDCAINPRYAILGQTIMGKGARVNVGKYGEPITLTEKQGTNKQFVIVPITENGRVES